MTMSKCPGKILFFYFNYWYECCDYTIHIDVEKTSTGIVYKIESLSVIINLKEGKQNGT